ncbi:hypothetical protein TRAPUB_11841, partial [Trametes pubescens]
MYVLKQNSFWTVEENQWLHEQLQDSEVRALVKLVGGQHDYGDAANEICTRFKVRFPNPRRGESAQEFWFRKKKHRGKYELSRWAPDTEDEYKQRVEKLKPHIRSWLSQHYTVRRVSKKGKVGALTVPPGSSGDAQPPRATLQPHREKNTRRKSALDMYQMSEDCPGRGDTNIGQWRHKNCLDWIDLSDEDRRRFTSEADEYNAAWRAARELEAPADDSPPVYDIDSMSGLVDDTIRVVHDTKYWGGLFIVAAPAGEADSDIYWSCTGTNRYGVSLLDTLCAVSNMTKNEFLLAIQMWAALCNNDEPAEEAPDCAQQLKNFFE